MSEKKETKKQQKLEQDIEEITGLLKRVQADFDNYRKRSQKEKEDFARYSNSDLLLRIIPVLDNFRLAFDHIPKDLQSNEWVHGIFHIRKQLEQLMTDEGVTEIKTETFDPAVHEAIEQVESEAPEGHIVEVVSAGYTMNGRVIRPAKVKVSRGKEHGLRAHKSDTEC